ncbi:2Fe-2S iron-sulfur cluster-binding protein [Pseudarthrobacter sulfonivorans]|uniref:2Fe-2S iron-sulfur cluster-binding protein n=1 Tax=Pseudarthrobacter sulfonivorans TaxID=121292 RepID=UPI00295E9F88|nr:2Fe-2S iron-sulfur cluster-binding protein [Pseudarthrobacter sulfonivorans]
MSKPIINVADREGYLHTLEWEPDTTLMETIRDNDLPILASCGGTASCATCHVYVQPKDNEQLASRSEDEDELLGETEAFRECESRLSCQIRFNPVLVGSTITLAPEE